jgi:hypothetical protein
MKNKEKEFRIASKHGRGREVCTERLNEEKRRQSSARRYDEQEFVLVCVFPAPHPLMPT